MFDVMDFAQCGRRRNNNSTERMKRRACSKAIYMNQLQTDLWLRSSSHENEIKPLCHPSINWIIVCVVLECSAFFCLFFGRCTCESSFFSFVSLTDFCWTFTERHAGHFSFSMIWLSLQVELNDFFFHTYFDFSLGWLLSLYFCAFQKVKRDTC